MFAQNYTERNTNSKGLRLQLVEVIAAVPLGQGVADSNAFRMQAATGSQRGRGWGEFRAGLKVAEGSLHALIQGRPPRLAGPSTRKA